MCRCYLLMVYKDQDPDIREARLRETEPHCRKAVLALPVEGPFGKYDGYVLHFLCLRGQLANVVFSIAANQYVKLRDDVTSANLEVFLQAWEKARTEIDEVHYSFCRALKSNKRLHRQEDTSNNLRFDEHSKLCGDMQVLYIYKLLLKSKKLPQLGDDEDSKQRRRGLLVWCERATTTRLLHQIINSDAAAAEFQFQWDDAFAWRVIQDAT